jgi:hypothetical protein
LNTGRGCGILRLDEPFRPDADDSVAASEEPDMSVLRNSITTAILVGAMATAATAQQVNDEAIVFKYRDLGIAVGNGYTCVSGNQKTLARVHSEMLFEMIMEEIGYPTAYEYAVAVGYGAGMDPARFDCAKVLPELSRIKQRLGLE